MDITRGLFSAPGQKRTPLQACYCIHDPRVFPDPQDFSAYLNFLFEVFPRPGILFPVGSMAPSRTASNSGLEVEISAPPDPSERVLREYARLKPEFANGVSRDLLFSESLFQEQERKELASFLGLDQAASISEIPNFQCSSRPAPESTAGLFFSDPPFPPSSGEVRSDTLLASIDSYVAKSPRRPLTRGLLCFRDALQTTAREPHSEEGPPSSRIVWSYWDDGESNAPDIVRLCFSRWRQLNPDYSVRVLSKSDLAEFFGGWDRYAPLPVAAFSDLLRIHLLATYGGVWADATVLPLIPLRLWLPAVLRSGFFAFSQGQTLMDQNPAIQAIVASWFLAAEPNTLIANRWYAAAQRTCNELVRTPPSRKPLTLVNGKAIDRICGQEYWWFHQEFTKLLASDPGFLNQWNQCYWWPMHIPHLLGTRKDAMQTHTHQARRQLLRKRLTPLLKLSAKYAVMKTLREYRILE